MRSASEQTRNASLDLVFSRFTRFTDDDGTTEYGATYTAFDGHRIAPRLLISPDLRVFRAHRLAGPAARNKGMALFPRKVRGRYLALCRSVGERTSPASSADGYVRDQPVLLQEPLRSADRDRPGLARAHPRSGKHILLVMKQNRRAIRRFVPGSPFNDVTPLPPVETYAIQDRVTHDRYGLGTVLGVEGEVAVLVDFGPQQVRITVPCSELIKL